jgi:hypothetical protein
MQISYRPAPICMIFSLNILKKVVRDQRYPTDHLSVVNTSLPFGEFTAPLRQILPIHNVTLNSNNLSCLWMSAGRSSFALRKSMTDLA